jgi:hypothetical protein
MDALVSVPKIAAVAHIRSRRSPDEVTRLIVKVAPIAHFNSPFQV